MPWLPAWKVITCLYQPLEEAEGLWRSFGIESWCADITWRSLEKVMVTDKRWLPKGTLLAHKVKCLE